MTVSMDVVEYPADDGRDLNNFRRYAMAAYWNINQTGNDILSAMQSNCKHSQFFKNVIYVHKTYKTTKYQFY